MTKTILTFTLFISILLHFSPGFSGNTKEKFLQVKGVTILDASGQPILLRGFNVQFKHFKNELGEPDIKRIADWGGNSIRLVMDYRDFVVAPFRYNEANFVLLDSLLNWCRKYSVFVILDMHLAPGFQNSHDFVVHRQTTFDFWSKEEHQELFYALWEKIAERYAQENIVAGYDLLNEGAPPTGKEYIRIMSTTIKKIRSRDKNHILIIEEALLPAGEKELFLIPDKNTVYSIHFFYPSNFSFYVTTTERVALTYPGAMTTFGEKISETKTGTIKGNTEWRQVSVRALPPEGAELLLVNISSQANSGTVWVDDIMLEADGRVLELPAPLVSNNSFEIDYPGISWNTQGACVSVTDKVARTGNFSLAFSDCQKPGSATSSPLEVTQIEYTLSGWYKAEQATGENVLSLSWHKRRRLGQVDRNTIREQLNYALQFKSLHKVPIYVGEFTAHANPARESVIGYLQDLIGIMHDEGLHWSFWEYYSEYPGVGLYTRDLRLANPEARDVLKRSLKE
jgi:Cellulase (glycosyl hydrolase family 5)